MAKGWCMHCKKSVEIQNAKEVKMKSGRKALQGICSKCGGKVFRMGN